MAGFALVFAAIGRSLAFDGDGRGVVRKDTMDNDGVVWDFSSYHLITWIASKRPSSLPQNQAYSK